MVYDFKFIEWLSAEDMHAITLKWLSELYFMQDEQLFFDQLIQSNIFELIREEVFAENKKIMDHLIDFREENKSLIARVETHRNGLEILVDGINQIEQEKEYKQSHKALTQIFNKHNQDYKSIKNEFFTTIKPILKKKKFKKFLEP